MADLGCNYGYGDWGNLVKIIRMRERDHKSQKEYIKKLWKEDPKRYEEWKNFCIDSGALPDFFGTADNPIPIDESKL